MSDDLKFWLYGIGFFTVCFLAMGADSIIDLILKAIGI